MQWIWSKVTVEYAHLAAHCHHSDLTTELGFLCTHDFSNGAVDYEPPPIHIYSGDKHPMGDDDAEAVFTN